jgi:hypothetical protein
MKAMLLSLCLCVIVTSGCASRDLGSFAGPLPETAAVSAIAVDASSIITELYPPGHTSLHVLPAKKENGFALALDNELRGKGFTLAASDSADAVTLAYTLDVLDAKAAWYLQLRLSDPHGGGKAIARAYDAHGQPEAGQSRTLLEASLSGLGKAVGAARDRAEDVSEAVANFWRDRGSL